MAIHHDRNLAGSQVPASRRKRRWPQRVLAKKLCAVGFEATRGWVAKVEDGELIVNDFHLAFLARALAVDYAELFQPCSRCAAPWRKRLSRRTRAGRQPSRRTPDALAPGNSANFE